MTPFFFETGDQKMAFYKTGGGKPLVMLHGWGAGAKVMMPLAKQLGDIRFCCLPDFPGFGASPEPAQPWSVGDYADLTEQFILQTFPGQNTDLLVHSYGARVALKLLAREQISQKINKVIVTGGAGLKPRRKSEYYLKRYTAKALKLPFYLFPGSSRVRALDTLRNTALWKKLGSSDYQALSGVMRETFVKSVTEYLDGLLPHIGHEILLIWGRNDTATPIDQAERMEKGLQNGTLVVIENAGHYAFLDKPKQFAAIARAYLEPER